MSCLWQISTPVGKKITIRLTVRKDNRIVERKDFDFPISFQWQTEDILPVLKQRIEHRNIFE